MVFLIHSSNKGKAKKIKHQLHHSKSTRLFNRALAGELRFEGKNKVVVRRAATAPRRDVAITEPRDPSHVVSGVKTDLMFERMRREHESAA